MTATFNYHTTAKRLIFFCLACLCLSSAHGQNAGSKFNVIAFYTGKEDLAHISFVHEANRWFPKMATKYNFTYDATTNWSSLNAEFLSHYKVGFFLDPRPEAPAKDWGFKNYRK